MTADGRQAIRDQALDDAATGCVQPKYYLPENGQQTIGGICR